MQIGIDLGDLLIALVMILVSVVGYFLANTLNDLKASIKQFSEDIKGLGSELNDQDKRILLLENKQEEKQ